MKQNKWRIAANQAIDKAIKEAPQGSDLKAAIDNAYPFGARKYTPYKIWLEERKKALTRLGLYTTPSTWRCMYHPNNQTCLFCK